MQYIDDAGLRRHGRGGLPPMIPEAIYLLSHRKPQQSARTVTLVPRRHDSLVLKILASRAKEVNVKRRAQLQAQPINTVGGIRDGDLFSVTSTGHGHCDDKRKSIVPKETAGTSQGCESIISMLQGTGYKVAAVYFARQCRTLL